METSTFTQIGRARPMTEPVNPALYYFVGRLVGLDSAARKRAASLQGQGYGEIAVNVMIRLLPDGLVMLHGGEFLITDRQQKVPFDAEGRTWTTKPGPDEPDMTPKEWAAWLGQEIKSYRAFIDMHKGR